MLAKRIALVFGIAVVFPMLVHYGVSTFSPAPKWNDYMVPGAFDPSASKEEREQRQVEQRKLQDERLVAEKRFQLHLFIVAAPLGLAAIICGAFLRIQFVGTGLIFGGIFSICDGYFNYWSELADSLKFMSLLAAFIVLVLVGYLKLEKKQG
jgi:hypothetical protein